MGFWIGLQCSYWVLRIFCWYEEEMNVFSQIIVHGFVFFCFRVDSYCSTLMLNPTLHWNICSYMSCDDLRLVQVWFSTIFVVLQILLDHHNHNHGWARCGMATFCELCIFQFFCKHFLWCDHCGCQAHSYWFLP